MPMPRARVWKRSGTLVQADAVANALRDALEGFHGAMGSTHVHAMVLNRIDDYDEDVARWRVILDARLATEDVEK